MNNKRKSFVDHLFSNGVAWKEFQRFSRTFSTDESEASLSVLAMFDILMSEAVKVFKKCYRNQSKTRTMFASSCTTPVKDFNGTQTDRKAVLVTKMGVPFPEKYGTSQGTMPKSCRANLGKYFFQYKPWTNFLPLHLWSKLSIKINGSKEECYNNHNKIFTSVARNAA